MNLYYYYIGFINENQLSILGPDVILHLRYLLIIQKYLLII